MEKDPIKDLFQDALRNVEIPVKPEVWQAVSSSLGHSAAATASTGMGLLTKLAIGIASVGVISAGVFYFTDSTENTKPLEEQQKTEIQPTIETKANEEINSSENVVSEAEKIIAKPAIQTTPNNEVIQEQVTTHKNHEVSLPISETSIAPVSPVVPQKITTVTNQTDVKHQALVVKETKVLEKAPAPVQVEVETVIVMPNIFTPNGDGSNDELSLNLPQITEFSLAVLDTKGTAVFRTQNPDFKWNGEGIDGQKVPAGDYVYFITGKDAKGKSISKYSRLTVKY